MSGVAGALIGLTTGAQPLIAEAQALIDGADTARGCTTNFIGFGLDLETDTKRAEEDFNVTDDTVVLGDGSGDEYEPTYTGTVLSWEVVGP